MKRLIGWFLIAILLVILCGLYTAWWRYFAFVAVIVGIAALTYLGIDLIMSGDRKE